MTEQYLVGELSLLLGQLQAATADKAAAAEIRRLRLRAEAAPPWALASVAARAREVADLVCVEALSRGDTAAFLHETAVGADLWEFSFCAGLLQEDL